jgi:hypothetical protein
MEEEEFETPTSRRTQCISLKICQRKEPIPNEGGKIDSSRLVKASFKISLKRRSGLGAQVFNVPEISE